MCDICPACERGTTRRLPRPMVPHSQFWCACCDTPRPGLLIHGPAGLGYVIDCELDECLVSTVVDGALKGTARVTVAEVMRWLDSGCKVVQ